MPGPKHFIRRYLTVAFGFPSQGCEPIGKAECLSFNRWRYMTATPHVHPGVVLRIIRIYYTPPRRFVKHLFSKSPDSPPRAISATEAHRMPQEPPRAHPRRFWGIVWWSVVWGPSTTFTCSQLEQVKGIPVMYLHPLRLRPGCVGTCRSLRQRILLGSGYDVIAFRIGILGHNPDR